MTLMRTGMGPMSEELRSMRLRLAQTDESIKHNAERVDETIPFHSTLPCPWKPQATFDPASKSFDSISHAEDALDHVERKMANIRKLLGMDENVGDGRAA